jgi:uncharacterized YceG family protein
MTDDWTDPFTDDEAAKEREARRQARNERRQKRLAAGVRRATKNAPDPPLDRPAEPPPAQVRDPETDPDQDPVPEHGQVPEPAQAGETSSPWAPRRPPSQSPPAGRATYRRRRIAVAALVAVLVVVGVFLVLLYQPFHGSGSGRVAVEVPKGASASQIADLLDQKGVISNSTFFRLRLSLSGDSGSIVAGKYTLASGMSYGDAIDALTRPPTPLKPKTTQVTIPEGYDRVQTAALVKQDGIEGDYEKASTSQPGFDPAKYGAKDPANLEGFLFPATYKVKPSQNVDDLVAQQLTAFQQQIKGVDMRYARSKNLTTYDVLIVASMIEREAMVPSDRAKVAAVIYNRLHDGTPLGIDATIRFIENNYTKALTQSDLAIDSPYNTRTNAGLPPGPISNPGLASIEAAARPAKVSYLYYNTKPGTCGKLIFATSAAEAQRNVDAYNAARNAAGGKSPTECG